MDEMKYEQFIASGYSEKLNELDDIVIALRAAGMPLTDEAIQSLIGEI